MMDIDVEALFEQDAQPEQPKSAHVFYTSRDNGVANWPDGFPDAGKNDVLRRLAACYTQLWKLKASGLANNPGEVGTILLYLDEIMERKNFDAGYIPKSKCTGELSVVGAVLDPIKMMHPDHVNITLIFDRNTLDCGMFTLKPTGKRT